MLTALTGAPSDIAWATEHSGASIPPDSVGIKAVDSQGRIRGTVFYAEWTETSVQAHMAVDTPIAWRALLPEVFRYPFVQCGRRLLMGTIAGDNRKSLILARHLGFEVTYRIRDAKAVGVDLVLVEMRREDCRWLSDNPCRSLVGCRVGERIAAEVT